MTDLDSWPNFKLFRPKLSQNRTKTGEIKNFVLTLKTKQKYYRSYFPTELTKISNVFSRTHLMIRAWPRGGGQPPQWVNLHQPVERGQGDDLQRRSPASSAAKGSKRHWKNVSTLAVFLSWGWSHGPRAWSHTC